MKLLVYIQHIIPQHLLSRLFGLLLNARIPLVKNTLIRMFIAYYNVDMGEVERADFAAYGCFNEFFIRRIQVNKRPVAQGAAVIASPCDGTIGQIGVVKQGELIQAKGRHFALQALLGGDAPLTQAFLGGHYNTTYLGPRDYHRVHMPVNGTLRQMIFVPGKLFSVSPGTVARVDDLFARNERLICIFDTDSGPMAVILVGAIFVGSMSVTWHGQVAPNRYDKQTTWDYTGANQPAINLQKGDELGYFQAGSTVITVFGAQQIKWASNLAVGTSLRFGQAIGEQQLTASAQSQHAAH